MYVRYALQLHEASAAIAAGCASAAQNGWRVSVAVVDEAGFVIALHRMDGASQGSVDTAIEKAKAAAFTGLPTKTLEDIIAARPAAVTMKRVAVEGGVPILHNGARLGGIGVSGVMPGQDATVALAALSVLENLHVAPEPAT